MVILHKVAYAVLNSCEITPIERYDVMTRVPIIGQAINNSIHLLKEVTIGKAQLAPNPSPPRPFIANPKVYRPGVLMR